MKIDKIVLEKSAEALLERAGDCFDLAASQHKMAERQHEDASRQIENELYSKVGDGMKG
jgi:hypothetical protein